MISEIRPRDAGDTYPVATAVGERAAGLVDHEGCAAREAHDECGRVCLHVSVSGIWLQKVHRTDRCGGDGEERPCVMKVALGGEEACMRGEYRRLTSVLTLEKECVCDDMAIVRVGSSTRRGEAVRRTCNANIKVLAYPVRW